jgi:hypothetical protein
MKLFVAVIYACLNGQCMFFHSLEFFNTEGECYVDLSREVSAFQKAYPQATSESTCIGIPIKGA